MANRFTPTPEQLQEIVDKHLAWWRSEPEGSRADLSGADLSRADLSRADLRGTDLRGADLSRADLRGADLRGTDLSGADLSRTDLSGADLSGADLRGTDLSGADLRGTDLSDCQMNWQSHALIAERLRRAAGEDAYKRLAAGYILVSRDWCWDELIDNVPDQVADLLPWALSEMRQWVKDGDDAPEILTQANDVRN